MNELARAMEQEEAAVRSALIDDLRELHSLNETLKPIEARKRILTDRIKQGMLLRGMDELADGETGVVGKIQDRNGPPLYDLVSMVERDGADAGITLMHAARTGMLRVDAAVLKRFIGNVGSTWADTLARYEMPGNATTALLIEKRDA